MNKLFSILVVMGAMTLAIVTMAQKVMAGEPCSGEKYEGHPALVAECLHAQQVGEGAGEAYPGPVINEPEPYPAPVSAPTATQGTVVTATQRPTSTPRPYPTEPPMPTEGG